MMDTSFSLIGKYDGESLEAKTPFVPLLLTFYFTAKSITLSLLLII